MEQLQERLAATRARTEDVQSRTQALLRPSSDELERIAREEYRMRREGEEVHHLVGGAETVESDDDAGSDRRP